MTKLNKITLISVAILVCVAIVAISVFSGTLAKYVTHGDFDHDLKFSRWRVNINCLNDLQSTYIKEPNKLVVEATDEQNVIVPGTRGALMCFCVEGNIGVASQIDFEGTFSIGDGFFANSRLVRNEVEVPVDYFPIIINLYTLDVVKTENQDDIVWDEEKKDIVINNSSGSSFKKTLIGSYGMQRGNDPNATYTTFTKLSDFNTANVGFNQALNTVMDSTLDDNIILNRYYVVEWEWPYEAPTGSTYQTDHLDTSICESVVNNKNSDLFKIKLNMKVTLSQIIQ